MNRGALNLGLAIALGLGVMLLWQLGDEPKAVVEPPPRSDYVLRDFELITLDKAGHESFTVRGPFLQRDVAGKSLSLVQPRFSFPDSSGDGRWKARANHAWVNPEASEVHLLERVRLIGPESAAGLVTRFMTERLIVLPETEEARTEERVTITQGDSILNGVGLRADLKAKRFTLQNQVKGRYAPRSP